MGSMSALGTATSGLKAAQAGLYVTGHNMSNVDTRGYSRQQALQQDFYSTSIGYGSNGKMQVGLGTDISQIRQIRDTFLDKTYRTQVTIGGFYGKKYEIGTEIENIIGELQSDYKTQSVIQDMWESLNELSIYPSGLETRGDFIATAQTFLNKVNNINDRLIQEQYNLNNQVKEAVVKINQLTTDIEKYNRLITTAEASGEHANDFRDARNVCLDELSKYMDITYKEDTKGNMDVMLSGSELVVNGVVNKIGLRYAADGYSFVEPVFTKSTTILPFDETGKNARSVYNLVGKVNSFNENDKGLLKGLLVSRGTHPVNHMTNPNPDDYDDLEDDPQYKKDVFNVNECTIPKVQKEIDTLVNKIITLINNAVSPLIGDPKAQDPNGPVGLDGSRYTEIFVRTTMDRFDSNGNYNEEDPNNKYSSYSIGNVTINPLLLNAENYDKIALSSNGDSGNFDAIKNIMAQWKSKIVSTDDSEPTTIDKFYENLVLKLAVETDEAGRFVNEQNILIAQSDNKRSQMSGVSLDEEMKNMMIYQHAYNAAAKVVNQIDSMIDRIINGTGRAGR